MSLLDKTARRDGYVTVPNRALQGWKGEIKALKLKLELAEARQRHAERLVSRHHVTSFTSLPPGMPCPICTKEAE